MQRLADDGEAFVGDLIVGGDDVIGLLEEARVDLVAADELDEVDRALALELDGVELVIVERDVFVLVDLEALDDVGGVDLADAGGDLEVADALARGLVDLVQRNVGGGFDRRVSSMPMVTRERRRCPFQ